MKGKEVAVKPLTTNCSQRGLRVFQRKADNKAGAEHPDPTVSTFQDWTLVLLAITVSCSPLLIVMLLEEEELYLIIITAVCFCESFCPCLCTSVAVNLARAGALSKVSVYWQSSAECKNA